LRDLATRRSLRALGGAAASIAAAGAAALAVAASAIVLQRLLHGSPVPVTPAYSTGPSSFHTYLALLQERSYHRLFLLLVQSFWGDFAWLSVPQPAIVYVAITVVLALAGLGLLVTLARRRLPVAPLLASGYALLVVA